MSLKRILIINYEFPPLGGGGARSSEHIAHALAQKGYDIVVMTSCFGDLPRFERVRGYAVHRIRTLRRHKEKSNVLEMCFFLVSSLFHVIPLYRKFKPQLTLSFFSIPCGPAALLLKTLSGVPYIVSLRGGDVPGFLPEQLKVYHRLSNWLTRWIWEKAAVITTCSQGLADLAKTFYNKREIVVVPNGVDEEFFYERASSHEPVFVQQVLRILTVGRHSEQKKVERLIESAERLVQKILTGFRLVIVGDGPTRGRLEDLALGRGLLNTYVFFVGWADREHLIRLYREADVFALASDFEGMPNVVLEAMASSLAVVATRAPGTVELVQEGQNGFLISRDQLTRFDESFLKLFQDRALLKRMQIQSHQASLLYSWGETAKGYQKLCESVSVKKEETSVGI